MVLLAVGGGLLLALALLVREYQLAKERTAQSEAYEQMRVALERTRGQLRRTLEDVYVLRTILAERHIIDEHELVRGRARLIDNPRRAAQEREQIMEHHEVSPTQLMVDDKEHKLH